MPSVVSEAMMNECPERYWEKGQRTYGDNIPGYAQGAYFPGDEPGWYCKITGDTCFVGMDIEHCGRTDWPNEEEES